MEKEEKRKLVFKEKTCQECSDTFIPKSGVQKFCKKEIEKVCPYCNEKYIVECGSREYYLFTCSKEPCKQARIKETNLKKFGCTNPSQNEEIKEKKRKTTLKHYGVENPSQSEKIKKKKRETTLENYGVENPSQSPVVLKRKQETTLKNYGVPHPMQSQKHLKKVRSTNLKKYGVQDVLASPAVRAKIIQTNIERYGFENPAQNEKTKEKIKQTNLEKYGVPYALQVPKVREKIAQTNLERYGAENVFASEEIKEKIKQKHIKTHGVESTNQKHIQHYNDWLNLEQFLAEHPQEFTSFELAKYFNTAHKYTRGVIVSKGLEYLVKDFNTLSIPEEKFAHQLNKLNVKYKSHVRKIISPLELDFYLPKYKLAIEVSPTFTHQYLTEESVKQNFMGVLDTEYHFNKFKLCKEQGIELITIFDWTDQEKVINFIKSKIEPAQTVYARNTTTKLVQGLTKEHKEFLERNHILGSINNSKTTEVAELHYNNEIVGLAVFEQKKNYTELRRLAFESGYRVQGGASKLIKTFAREHTELRELITFSDNDLGTGNVYKTLGFKVIEENKGTLIWYNYKYDKKIPNLSLVKQGTDRLLKNFPDYEYVGQGEHLPSNQEIIQQYGFLPIYDCGYTKWVLAL